MYIRMYACMDVCECLCMYLLACIACMVVRAGASVCVFVCIQVSTRTIL